MISLQKSIAECQKGQQAVIDACCESDEAHSLVEVEASRLRQVVLSQFESGITETVAPEIQPVELGALVSDVFGG